MFKRMFVILSLSAVSLHSMDRIYPIMFRFLVDCCPSYEPQTFTEEADLFAISYARWDGTWRTPTTQELLQEKARLLKKYDIDEVQLIYRGSKSRLTPEDEGRLMSLSVLLEQQRSKQCRLACNRAGQAALKRCNEIIAQEKAIKKTK